MFAVLPFLYHLLAISHHSLYLWSLLLQPLLNAPFPSLPPHNRPHIPLHYLLGLETVNGFRSSKLDTSCHVLVLMLLSAPKAALGPDSRSSPSMYSSDSSKLFHVLGRGVSLNADGSRSCPTQLIEIFSTLETRMFLYKFILRLVLCL